MNDFRQVSGTSTLRTLIILLYYLSNTYTKNLLTTKMPCLSTDRRRSTSMNLPLCKYHLVYTKITLHVHVTSILIRIRSLLNALTQLASLSRIGSNLPILLTSLRHRLPSLTVAGYLFSTYMQFFRHTRQRFKTIYLLNKKVTRL